MALPSNTSRIGESSDDDFVLDFVFVENEFEDGASDDDDDSYDYCEDVRTIISNNNSNSEEDVLLLADSIVEDDDTTSPTTGLKDSVITVPSVLLKDLDEAHEAAKLTLMTDPDEGNTLNDIVTTCSDDEHGLVDAEEKDNTLSLSSQQPPVVENSETETSEPSLSTSEPTMSSGNNEDSTGMEDSPSLVPQESPSTVPTDATPLEVQEVSTTSMATTKSSPLQTFIIMPATKPGSNAAAGAAPCFILANFPKKEGSATMEEKQSNGDTKTIASTNNTGSATKKTSGPVSISRTSNKKRRKKLKLLKKAQAADKFQQQAALLNMTGGKINKKLIKQSKKQQTPSRVTSKKVANVAVSCALETMSSYRKELAVQAK